MKKGISVLGLLFILTQTSCDKCKISRKEERNYSPFTYAVWTRVADIDENGRQTNYFGDKEQFVRQWYGWTLTSPQRGIDSLFIYRNNRIIFKDAVINSTPFCGQAGKFRFTTSRSRYTDIEFFIERKGNAYFIEVSDFVEQQADLNKVKKARYVYDRSEF